MWLQIPLIILISQNYFIKNYYKFARCLLPTVRMFGSINFYINFAVPLNSPPLMSVAFFLPLFSRLALLWERSFIWSVPFLYSVSVQGARFQTPFYLLFLFKISFRRWGVCGDHCCLFACWGCNWGFVADKCAPDEWLVTWLPWLWIIRIWLAGWVNFPLWAAVACKGFRSWYVLFSMLRLPIVATSVLPQAVSP